MNAFSKLAAGIFAIALLHGCADPNRGAGIDNDSWRVARVDRGMAATQTDVEPIDGVRDSERTGTTQALAVSADKEALSRRSVLFFPVRLPIW